jgi:hypothetical protein
MHIHTTEKLKIWSIGSTEAAVIAHGMYDPKRILSSKGTEKIRVPGGLTVCFWALKEEFGTGSLGRMWESVRSQDVSTRVKGGQYDSSGPKILNYIITKIDKSTKGDESGAGAAMREVKSAFKGHKDATEDEEAVNPMQLIRDLITVRKGLEACLKDVFDAIEHFHLRYTRLQLLHCRVTRKTAYGAHD